MSGELFWKIVFYGSAGTGKTTIIDTLHRKTLENPDYNLEPTGQVTKIAKASGATLYFDRGIFQSRIQTNIFYHIFTVAGQENLAPLRKKILDGVDAIAFVFDGQRSMLDRNLKSLDELKETLGPALIHDIPVLILINKQDLPDSLKQEDVFEIFSRPNFPISQKELEHQNFVGFFETCALYSKEMNICSSFIELIEQLSTDPKLIPKHLIQKI
ncbi:hypothetical protein NEF87_004651 [Candidatus Lokiarchaeum ossiferum]|uniref:Small GTP-binding domain protein n=1 Tax=Candidatus Lokiarchaeum ossiferum TaxID=2951803 RepID=A0ABY6HYE7_9ARCH|nr:hypothetical protein NEF87_004651 [Candidatus Lokiarchaeum sp. B-35]